jgi:LysM repeat protein
MLHMMKRVLFLLAILLFTTSCSSGGAPETSSTLTIAPPINPYQSTTSTPQSPTPTVPVPTSEPLIPTATPFKHAVQPGETLYGIAIEYNISLDQLVLANPGIDTSMLSVGTELVIPLAEEELSAPTPTPYPLSQQEAVCYPTQDSGRWCYMLVENDQEIALENISVALNIYNTDQELIQSVIAFPPLNILFPDQSIPVGAWIENPPEDWDQVTASLLTALPADREEPAVEIIDYAVTYSLENRIARVSGTYQIVDLDAPGSQVWIAGVALSDEIPVGMRKWTSSQDLTADTPFSFEFQIYSLGPRIDRVQLLAELH